jgi:aminoglycoside N3'-acetyltransferase
MNVISTETLVRQLLELGVMPGGVLLVHTSFSKVKPVEGGPEGLIRALQAALGAPDAFTRHRVGCDRPSRKK